MRLIGAGEPESLIAADISASLRGLGRGDDSVGGVALMHVTPHGFSEAFDAVVVTPHGVLLISGVELPGPTMRLDAPLHGQWKADNWPLVGSGEAVNPGAPALAASRQLAHRLTTETGLSMPISTVLAVGPFVDAVMPGHGDLDNPVRVLYPTINGLKDAIAALAPPRAQPCSAEQARAILRAIDPATPIQPDSTLAKEGFPNAVTTARTTAASPPAASPPQGVPSVPQSRPSPAAGAPQSVPAPHPHATAQSAARAPQSAPPHGLPSAAPTAAPLGQVVPGRAHPDASVPPHQQATNGARRRPVLLRPVPIVVVCLLVVGLIAVIAVATAGASDSSPAAAATPRTPDLVIHHVDGLDFQVMAADTDRRCASHTYGDLRTAVVDADCAAVHLGSYLTAINDRRAAVSIATFEFRASQRAHRLEKLISTSGTGWARDLGTTRDAWPDAPGVGPVSYHSDTSGDQLRLVRVRWLDDAEPSDDTSLATVAQRAFAVPMPNLR